MDTKIDTHEDIIEAMVAEHAQNELAAEERKRQEAAELERQKYAKFGQAVALIRAAVVAEAARLRRLHGVNARYTERMRSQS